LCWRRKKEKKRRMDEEMRLAWLRLVSHVYVSRPEKGQREAACVPRKPPQ
jgi:hypothetical protein